MHLLSQCFQWIQPLLKNTQKQQRTIELKENHAHARPGFFNRFIVTEPFGAFRLLAEAHAATQQVVPFQMDRNIIFLHT